jgi:DNA-binding MarR family transcriptional regulator
MSNDSRRALLEAIGAAVQAFQEATDEMDEAVAAALGLNRTDLRCLSILSRQPVGAGALAAAAGLTRGATTTALDRLEARGYARRVWDQRDRRRLRAEMTGAARAAVARIYGVLAADGARMLRKYTTAELEAILRYLDAGRALQRAHAEQVRRAKRPPRRKARQRSH